jgi:ornithine--oxo-acid transaminase
MTSCRLFQVSAVLCDDSIMLNIKPGQHGSTYGGNPLACVVAQEAIQVIIDEKLCENAMALESVLRDELMRLPKSLIKLVRGKGLMWAAVINENGGLYRSCSIFVLLPVRPYPSCRLLNFFFFSVFLFPFLCLPATERNAWNFAMMLAEKGLLSKPTRGDTLRFTPPIVIKKDELLEACGIIHDVAKNFS